MTDRLHRLQRRSSPLVSPIGDKVQVIAPQVDGWVRTFDALSGKLIWKFDTNPPESYKGGTSRERNNVLATPVLYKGRLDIANGHTPDHPFGAFPDWLYCLDPTKTGNISFEKMVDGCVKLPLCCDPVSVACEASRNALAFADSNG